MQAFLSVPLYNSNEPEVLPLAFMNLMQPSCISFLLFAQKSDFYKQNPKKSMKQNITCIIPFVQY